MKRNICVGGITGKVGRELAAAIVSGGEFRLSGALARRHAGKPLSGVLGLECGNVMIQDSITEALQSAEIYIDFTSPETVRQYAETAIRCGVHVVVGASGLTDNEYAGLEALALEKGVSVFAAGNFSITAALLQYFAKLAARVIPAWEILDYGSDGKRDAPSGTSRELAFQLGKIRAPHLGIPLDEVLGLKEARGGTLNGSQIHSLRLPGFYSSSEIVFGLPGERLSMRHDSISSAPYVQGALLAARASGSFTGLRRGLESVMNFNPGNAADAAGGETFYP